MNEYYDEYTNETDLFNKVRLLVNAQTTFSEMDEIAFPVTFDAYDSLDSESAEYQLD